ncbi:unnamed protein product [Mucor hiemalis]
MVVMFIGDRGTGVGSRLKGFLKYGGKWKPTTHSKYSTVCYTNEQNTSQTRLFCYSKLLHPSKLVTQKNGTKFLKDINGSFFCVNHLCLSTQRNRSVQARDRLSALAIAVSGLSTLVFGETMCPFNSKLSENTDNFKLNAAQFLKKKQSEAHVR